MSLKAFDKRVSYHLTLAQAQTRFLDFVFRVPGLYVGLHLLIGILLVWEGILYVRGAAGNLLGTAKGNLPLACYLTDTLLAFVSFLAAALCIRRLYLTFVTYRRAHGRR